MIDILILHLYLSQNFVPALTALQTVLGCKVDVALHFLVGCTMSTLSSANYDYSKWEKVGDVYKQFSIYDTSKYESMSSSNIILNK